MDAINLDDLDFRNKVYGGANGRKKQILLNDELYMLKFEPIDNNGMEILVHALPSI